MKRRDLFAAALGLALRPDRLLTGPVISEELAKVGMPFNAFRDDGLSFTERGLRGLARVLDEVRQA